MPVPTFRPAYRRSTARPGQDHNRGGLRHVASGIARREGVFDAPHSQRVLLGDRIAGAGGIGSRRKRHSSPPAGAASHPAEISRERLGKYHAQQSVGQERRALCSLFLPRRLSCEQFLVSYRQSRHSQTTRPITRKLSNSSPNTSIGAYVELSEWRIMPSPQRSTRFK